MKCSNGSGKNVKLAGVVFYQTRSYYGSQFYAFLCILALKIVETIDFMTARFAHLPFEFLELVSRRIINEVSGISRVAYDISGKPQATIEWE
jgi:GMP synthase PP-ATPase subunit